MNSFTNILVKFFGVVARSQTYLNLLYLFLAFPLGVAYFVFLVTGISVGVPLIIVWVGLLITAGVIAAWYGLIVFERKMAIWLLHEDIPPITHLDLSSMSLWQKFVALLKNPVTWKGLAFLFAKFPMGMISFVALVTLASISLSLIGMPFYYQWVHSDISIDLGNAIWNPMWAIDRLDKALLVSLIGVLLAIASMHILNGLAWVSGKFARVMLGNFSPAPAAPAAPEVSAIADPASVE
jgi:hypothetical protein